MLEEDYYIVHIISENKDIKWAFDVFEFFRWEHRSTKTFISKWKAEEYKRQNDKKEFVMSGDAVVSSMNLPY